MRHLLDLRLDLLYLGRTLGIATGAGAPQVIPTQIVSANYFQVLGLRPSLGRFFTSADDEPSAGPVVVLSYQVWRERFSSSPTAVGSVVRLNGQPVTVIGIGPKGFAGLSPKFSEGRALTKPLPTSSHLPGP